MRIRHSELAILAMALGAGMQINSRYIDPNAKRLRKPETNRPAGEASPEQQKPLLTGRKGKGTRKSRKQRS